jgi:hypothetical protein
MYKTQLEVSLNSKETTSNTNDQESFHLDLIFDAQRTISDRANMIASPTFDQNSQVVDTYSNSHIVKTYMITEEDLIQFARVKENEQYNKIGVENVEKHINGHPVITFSISGNDLVHLELVQGKNNEQENEVTESLKEKEQIENFKGNVQIENGSGRIESCFEDKMPENFKENGYIIKSIHIENSEVNEEIENQAGFIENSEKDDQTEISVQNGHVESSYEHEQIENTLQNEYLEISKKSDYSSKQILRRKSSKNFPRELKKYRYLFFFSLREIL